MVRTISIMVKRSGVRARADFATGVRGKRPSRRVAGVRVAHDTRRGFFSAAATHHVATSSLARDLLAAGALVLAVVSWGALFALLAG